MVVRESRGFLNFPLKISKWSKKWKKTTKKKKPEKPEQLVSEEIKTKTVLN